MQSSPSPPHLSPSACCSTICVTDTGFRALPSEGLVIFTFTPFAGLNITSGSVSSLTAAIAQNLANSDGLRRLDWFSEKTFYC